MHPKVEINEATVLELLSEKTLSGLLEAG